MECPDDAVQTIRLIGQILSRSMRDTEMCKTRVGKRIYSRAVAVMQSMGSNPIGATEYLKIVFTVQKGCTVQVEVCVIKRKGGHYEV